ncbi:tyrosine-type recombinase/integrase [Gilvibacter sp.]|uniref:tyrosine-type recombinase/integrase n=1 Tax=Gilvibacter sp. TaxID=2729997 RepID=UPI003B51DE6A
MASISYRLRGVSKNNPIYLRLSLDRDNVFERKTGLFCEKSDWQGKASGLPKQTTAENKNLRTKLKELELRISKRINIAQADGTTIDGDWLSYEIDLFFKRINESGQSDLILDIIDRVINSCRIKKNAKGDIGLSKSRIDSYKSLKSKVEAFQGRKKLKIKDVDIRLSEDFIKFMMDDMKYSESYTLKTLANLKTVCNHAEILGIETSPQLKKISSGHSKNKYIVYLNGVELKQIEEAHIVSDALRNARKWLLLGCNIGQRVSDLLDIDESNFVIKNGIELIELTQKKGGKQINIPVLETTKEILGDGLPYKISSQKFNYYIKEICKVAGIDQEIKGALKNPETNRKEEGLYPKYKLVASHVCRRSFATNLYGVLPTPLIMQITGHSTEKMFLKYIGKSSLDYAQQIADFYELQRLKAKKEPQLNLIDSNLK